MTAPYAAVSISFENNPILLNGTVGERGALYAHNGDNSRKVLDFSVDRFFSPPPGRRRSSVGLHYGNDPSHDFHFDETLPAGKVSGSAGHSPGPVFSTT